jgi:hypothetical protein
MHSHYASIFNPAAMAMIATTMKTPTTGEIFLELPLRGESFGAD